MHPLALLVIDALAGRFPAADGGWRRVAPWRDGVEAVVAFTGHAVIAVGDDVTDERLVDLGVDGYGGAHHPRVLLDLAGPLGWIDSLDALLATRGHGGRRLVERPDLTGHPRVAFARSVRDEVVVFGRPNRASRSVATASRGVGGLWELSVELDKADRGRGAGSALVTAALTMIPAGDPVAAAVAPGNAASLRAFLGAGFQVLGSVQLFRPRRGTYAP